MTRGGTWVGIVVIVSLSAAVLFRSRDACGGGENSVCVVGSQGTPDTPNCVDLCADDVGPRGEFGALSSLFVQETTAESVSAGQQLVLKGDFSSVARFLSPQNDRVGSRLMIREVPGIDRSSLPTGSIASFVRFWTRSVALTSEAVVVSDNEVRFRAFGWPRIPSSPEHIRTEAEMFGMAINAVQSLGADVADRATEVTVYGELVHEFWCPAVQEGGVEAVVQRAPFQYTWRPVRQQ